MEEKITFFNTAISTVSESLSLSYCNAPDCLPEAQTVLPIIWGILMEVFLLPPVKGVSPQRNINVHMAWLVVAPQEPSKMCTVYEQLKPALFLMMLGDTTNRIAIQSSFYFYYSSNIIHILEI